MLLELRKASETRTEGELYTCYFIIAIGGFGKKIQYAREGPDL
jgi:hypothetical protein